VRDCRGSLVISHDPATGDEMALGELLALYRQSGLTLALNVKADGLAEPLTAALQGTGIDWFAFDMSGPETLRYLRAGAPVFTRHSDIEREPLMYAHAQGVWLDGLLGDWFGPDEVIAHRSQGKKVCIVSSELHGRDTTAMWDWLRRDTFIDDDGLYVCTDYPEALSRHLQPAKELSA